MTKRQLAVGPTPKARLERAKKRKAAEVAERKDLQGHREKYYLTVDAGKEAKESSREDLAAQLKTADAGESSLIRRNIATLDAEAKAKEKQEIIAIVEEEKKKKCKRYRQEERKKTNKRKRKKGFKQESKKKSKKKSKESLCV